MKLTFAAVSAEALRALTRVAAYISRALRARRVVEARTAQTRLAVYQIIAS